MTVNSYAQFSIYFSTYVGEYDVLFGSKPTHIYQGHIFCDILANYCNTLAYL